MPCSLLANSFWQLDRIMSNTGAASETELLITSSTAEVAVCCSSASLVSLNRRTFSIAITAWSAKVLSRSIWRCGVSPASGQATWIVPMGTPSLSMGAAIIRRQPPMRASGARA